MKHPFEKLFSKKRNDEIDQEQVAYTLAFEKALSSLVHSVAANGRWCGDQRPPCGLKTAG